jgi:hypothetical protein
MTLIKGCRNRPPRAGEWRPANPHGLLGTEPRKTTAEIAGRMQGAHTDIQKTPPAGPEAKRLSTKIMQYERRDGIGSGGMVLAVSAA